jgi:hypothetical protein
MRSLRWLEWLARRRRRSLRLEEAIPLGVGGMEQSGEK